LPGGDHFGPPSLTAGIDTLAYKIYIMMFQASVSIYHASRLTARTRARLPY
jgi:hypothetical protein